MEKLQTKLFEAATQNSIASLHELLKNDPLLLDRELLNTFDETPLHVAAMLGNLEFMKEIIRLKPELVNECNLQQSTPLHLASSKGHVGVVKALLSVDKRACFIRDRNGVLPLHLAAAKGRVEAMKVLLEADPDAAMVKSHGGESILHLCVKRCQMEALRLIVESVRSDDQFINSRDGNGNTVLHLAVTNKQVEATKYIVSVGGVDVNAENQWGFTALDVLIRSRDLRDFEIDKSLKNVGGFANLENNNNNSNNKNQLCAANSSSKVKWWWSFLKRHDERFETQKGPLMVVASLIPTMAFQVAANPTGGIWQEDKLSDDPPKVAGESVFAYQYANLYEEFYIVNTVAFMASLSTILLLMSRLPIGRRLYTWILIVTTWIAITALAYCFLELLFVLTPKDDESLQTIVTMIHLTLYAWIGLMCVLLLGHTIHIVAKLVKTV